MKEDLEVNLRLEVKKNEEIQDEYRKLDCVANKITKELEMKSR
jgi:hypothetical protein